MSPQKNREPASSAAKVSLAGALLCLSMCLSLGLAACGKKDSGPANEPNGPGPVAPLPAPLPPAPPPPGPGPGPGPGPVPPPVVPPISRQLSPACARLQLSQTLFGSCQNSRELVRFVLNVNDWNTFRVERLRFDRRSQSIRVLQGLSFLASIRGQGWESRMPAPGPMLPNPNLNPNPGYSASSTGYTRAVLVDSGPGCSIQWVNELTGQTEMSQVSRGRRSMVVRFSDRDCKMERLASDTSDATAYRLLRSGFGNSSWHSPYPNSR